MQCLSFVLLTFLINDSFKANIQNKIINLDGFVTIYKKDYGLLGENDYQIISNAIDSSYQINKILEKEGFIRCNGRSEAVIVKYIDFENLDFLKNNININYLDGFDYSNVSIIIGEKLFDKIELQQNVHSYSNLNYYLIHFNEKVIDKVLKYNNPAVFTTHIPDYDEFVVYADINKYYEHSQKNTQLSSIIITPKYDTEYELELGEYILSHYSVEYWYQKHSHFIKWLNLYDAPINILLAFIMLVCIVNILSSNYIDYSYRIKELNTLNILGMQNSDIKFIFAFKSLILTLIGTFLGYIQSFLIIALQLKYNIIKIPSSVYYMNQLLISPDYNLIVFSSILFFVLVFIISYLSIPNNLKIKV